MPTVEFPTPIIKNGRRYFLRHQLENYKRSLAGLPLIDENGVSVIELVPRCKPPRSLAKAGERSGVA